MGRMWSSQQTSTTETKSLSNTLSTSSKRCRTSHFYTPLGINRRCGFTIVAPFGKGHSKSGFWCYVGSRATKIATSYQRHGKAPSSSTKFFVPVPTSLRMKTADPSPTPGTLNSYIVSTLKEKESFRVPSREDSLVFPLQPQSISLLPNKSLVSQGPPTRENGVFSLFSVPEPRKMLVP
jgi:hypothetical protein